VAVLVGTDRLTGHEIVSFWNPRVRRRQLFLRHAKTKRFVRLLRELWVCATCGAEYESRRDETRNIIFEAMGCVAIVEEEWKDLREDAQFIALVDSTEDRSFERCVLKSAEAFGPDIAELITEVERIEYFSGRPREAVIYRRPRDRRWRRLE